MSGFHGTAAATRCVLIVVLLSGGTTTYGLPTAHSPFFSGENIVLTMDVCDPIARKIVNVHPAEGSVAFTAPDGLTLRLSISTLSDPYTEAYYAQITRGEEEITPAVQVPLVATVASLLPTKAICQDLNNDGIVDFITDHWKHGNGLGARFYDRLLVLSSSAGGYRFWISKTMDPSAEDYVVLGKDGALAMVTTLFANSGGAKPRSYYVYDLWMFRSGEVVPANYADSRFPKWIRMTIADNHKPAASLSQEVKRRMLDPRQAEEVRLEAVN